MKLDVQGRPVWTKELAKRSPVFSYPGACQRLDVVYNPGVRRYRMALSYGHNGAWGLGGTHGYRLPSKWISPDGRTMYLVFSGVKPNDAFCVRRFTLAP